MNSPKKSVYSEVVAIGKYLAIHKEDNAGGPTTRYRIMAKKPPHLIGWIRWYGPWREWCFLPCEGTVWSATCLSDVLYAVKQLNTVGTTMCNLALNHRPGS